MSALLCVVPASSQTTTGSIYGTVADQSGAVIPSATIQVTNVETGETQTATSDSAGNYIFPALSPGRYTVSSQISGFRRETESGIQLDVTQNVHVSFTLQPGSDSQSVTVTAATTLVDTRESQLGETVDQKRISDLPLNGRNAYDLVQIVPGVTNYTAESTIGDNTGAIFSVNGIRTNFNTFYLDGAFDTAVFRDGGNLIPNPDAIEQFRLLTSNFDAEFGRAPGGVVNIITRSGTNTYHGLLYEYLRNNILNAKNYFSTSGTTPLKQNQFGGTFGGPIVRDKAFGFLSYEGLRVRTPAQEFAGAVTTLTPLEATGNFSLSAVKPTLPAGTNCGTTAAPIICNGTNGPHPNALDPVAQNLLKYVPLEDPTTLQSPEQSAPANTNVNQGLARVDYQLTDKHEVSVMFFTSRGLTLDPLHGPNQIEGFSGASLYASQTNAVVSDRWIVSPNAVNSLRFFYTLNHAINTPLFSNTWANYGSHVAQASFLTDQPDFAITGFWTMGMGGNSGNTNEAQQAFGAMDTLNWTRGNHTVRAGGSFIWNTYDQTGVSNGSGKATFTTASALANFLLGQSAVFTQGAPGYPRLHQADPALFVQDDWRLTHRLTLDLGLRWELYPPFTGQNNDGTFEPNVQSTRFPAAPLGLLSVGDAGVPDGILRTSWKRFAPRAGFAYDVFGNGATSLRGAYGIFYAVNQVTFADNLVQQPFTLAEQINKTPNLVCPYGGSVPTCPAGTPAGTDPFPYVFNPSSPFFPAGATISGLPSNESSTPYVQEYNLTLQQQFGTNWATQIAYVGSSSRKFYIYRDQNSPAFVAGAAVTTAGLNARRLYEPTPATYTFGVIGEYDPAGNATYNSLQVTLKRQFDHDFSLLASYVWSKAMDDISVDPSGAAAVLVNENNIAMDHGLSNLDVPQRFVASYLWAAPTVRLWGWIGKQALSGWQLNGITTLSTGSPFTVTSNVDTNLDGNATDRPNQVGNPILPGGRSRSAKIAEFFNTSAFAQVPANVPYGNVRRNSLIGPGQINTDLSAFKSFPIWRESTLQFRGEIFNLFNNVNLSNPNGVLTAPKFGTITTAGNPRKVQFALRYSF